MCRALGALSKESDIGEVAMTDFRPFCKTHQALMAPVFSVQNKLKIATLGESFWEQISTRHVEVRKGYTVPLSDLMVLVRVFFFYIIMMRIHLCCVFFLQLALVLLFICRSFIGVLTHYKSNFFSTLVENYILIFA